jgi:hypothetical protein
VAVEALGLRHHVLGHRFVGSEELNTLIEALGHDEMLPARSSSSDVFAEKQAE